MVILPLPKRKANCDPHHHSTEATNEDEEDDDEIDDIEYGQQIARDIAAVLDMLQAYNFTPGDTQVILGGTCNNIPHYLWRPPKGDAFTREMLAKLYKKAHKDAEKQGTLNRLPITPC